MKCIRKAQSTLEYSILIIVVAGALLAMTIYIKRGIQGRWRGQIDNFGDQYDPTVAVSNITFTTVGNSVSELSIQEEAGSYWSKKKDSAYATETKTGQTNVPNY